MKTWFSELVKVLWEVGMGERGRLVIRSSLTRVTGLRRFLIWLWLLQDGDLGRSVVSSEGLGRHWELIVWVPVSLKPRKQELGDRRLMSWPTQADAEFVSCHVFCSLWVFTGLDGAHPCWGGSSTLQTHRGILLNQMWEMIGSIHAYSWN